MPKVQKRATSKKSHAYQKPKYSDDDDDVYDGDDNNNTDQNLSPAGEGCDMEGHVGEDEERVGVLGKLLKSRHIVRPRERQVDEEAEILRVI